MYLHDTEGLSERNLRLLQELAVLVKGLAGPCVVAGDFNSPRDTAVHHAMRRNMTDAWEAGAWGPGSTVRLWGMVPMRVDYLYATASLPTKRAWIPEVDCSDHRPLLSRFSVQAM